MDELAEVERAILDSFGIPPTIFGPRSSFMELAERHDRATILEIRHDWLLGVLKDDEAAALAMSIRVEPPTL